MSSPPATEDLVEDIEYIEEEDDDDDEEDDFVPGADEDDDDDDDDGSEVVPLLDGKLFWGAQHALHYQGEGFHLTASESTPWNILNSKSKPTSNEFELIMTGPCDFETAGAKATPRKIKVTFTVTDPPVNGTSFGKRSGRAKADDDDDDGVHDVKDEKQDSKAPGVYYSVFGSQIDAIGIDLLQFQGGFYPPSTETEKVGLVCQARMIASSQTPVAAAAAAAAPAAKTAAAARVDEEDDAEDADEDVDYNELIALHEDAGMSVTDLKKRYRDGSKPSTRSEKKLKAAPAPPDDSEDFDGF